MSTPRKRGGLQEEHVEHVDERWMASYMDMVTVLMCMFIVLFAMSSVDADKFEKLKNSLATGFGASEVGSIDTAEGIVVPADRVGEEGEPVEIPLTPMELAKAEVDKLEALKEQMRVNLANNGLEHTVEFKIDERGLTIRLVGSETFFGSNSVALAGVAPAVLDAVSPVLAVTSYEIAVEGHADSRAPGAPFATNWELSSGRATQVLRRLVESGGVGQERIGAVGFGSARPMQTGDTEAAMAANRRVDIVVISDQPESVRALIPSVLEQYVNASPASLPKG
ncbi:chemotaxis protein MotB [Conyzicola nivalis]|jgi:chemotaxis protein MotB|uniref:Chemotaxis protein MotB n=1 Tax=Conyzicola nivalis TaxID=1477021 RepID=A0ABV2QSG5_9MICO